MTPCRFGKACMLVMVGSFPLAAFAQGVQIPSERQLETWERQDIETRPLSTGPRATGRIGSQIEEMDRRDRDIDERALRGICRDC